VDRPFTDGLHHTSQREDSLFHGIPGSDLFLWHAFRVTNNAFIKSDTAMAIPFRIFLPPWRVCGWLDESVLIERNSGFLTGKDIGVSRFRLP